ncbi:unnamed protein product [Didymodactylos carnosus]|uniref:Uncharacterized protein n=1 Tax=Didymodactylos carnosus TaxID=1234261 RepID=A0A816BZY0_9BILA|nr:unnamed protein product [Didymodactylos carnosus]CAF4499433.1 unnamed protein product [Didymodactylos carnosus]
MEGEAFRYDPANSYDSHPQLHIGQMTDVCSYCDALKWPGEAPGICCSGGTVRLPALRPPPEPLKSLIVFYYVRFRLTETGACLYRVNL